MQKVTGYIEQKFKGHIPYSLAGDETGEVIRACFPVDWIPPLFFVCSEGEPVSVHAFCLINNVSEEEKGDILQKCNKLSSDPNIGFFRFYLDDDGDVDASYEIPLITPDEAIWGMAVEIFARYLYGVIPAFFEEKFKDFSSNSHNPFMNNDEIDEMKREPAQYAIEQRTSNFWCGHLSQSGAYVVLLSCSIVILPQ